MTPAGVIVLKRHEGLRLRAYLCPAGVPSIGYGHTGDVTMGDVIDRTQADAFLADDIAEAEAGANAVLGAVFPTLTPTRQDAVVNLVFNIGPGRLRGFKKFLAAVKKGQWETAGRELKESKWYGQVGSRADDIITMIKTG